MGALWFGVPVWALSLLRTSLRLHLLTCKTWNNADVISDICKGPGVQLILKTQRFRLASRTLDQAPDDPSLTQNLTPSGPFSLGRPPSLTGPCSHGPPIRSLPAPSPPTAVSPGSNPHKRSACLLLSWIRGPHPDKKDLRQLTKYTLDVMYLLSDKMKSKSVERKRKKEASYLWVNLAVSFLVAQGKREIQSIL